MLASYAISRYSFKFKDLFGLFCQSPGLIPIIVIAIALLMFFSLLKWKISFITLLIGHILITIPYCFRILLPSLQGIDKSYDEAALIFGASKFNIFRKIIFPLLKPAIFSASLFSFIVSFGNLSLSLFLSKPGTSTLTVALFQKAEYGQDPSLSAISGIFILFSIIGVLVIQKTIGKYYRRKKGKSTSKEVQISDKTSDDCLYNLINEAKELDSSDIHIEIYE